MKLSFLLALTVLASAFSVEWPAAHAQGQGARHAVEEIYRRPLAQDPATLDPARISDIYSRSVAQQIFDGLVEFDRTLTIMPALAQFWRASRDGLTWTFTLRKGVKFHHGRELTADDVVYSFTRILDPRIKSGAADLFMSIKGARDFRERRATSVAGLSALDRYTVRVVLEDARVPFVSVLAVGHAKIVPKDVVEREGEAFGAHPIGTGPFKFVRWDRGKGITLEANRDYWGGAPRLSRLVYRVFAGDNVEAMYREFVKGRLEDAPIPDRDYMAALSSRKYVHVKRPMLSVRFYGLNSRVRPFQDRRVRQAFVHAVNRERIVKNIFLGRYALARGVLPPGTQGFNPQLTSLAYDPALARQLLARAGFPEGRGLPAIEILSGARDDVWIRMNESVEKDLAAIGVRAHVKYETQWPVFSKLLEEGKFQIFLYTWYADIPDPDNFLSKLFYSSSSRNFFGYRNPVVDDLLVHAHNERDAQHRVELYRRAEQLIVDDAPFIPIFHYTYERLFQPYVRSVEVSGLGDPYIPLRKIWLERPR